MPRSPGVSAPPSDPVTPPSLLERLRRPGDAAAWDWFARLYTPLLYSWARRAGLQEADAADLVQEVFAALVRKLPEFRYDPGGSFRGWLRAVLVNKGRELRRRAPPPAGCADPAELPDPAAGLPEPEDYRAEVVSRALALLRPDFRPATWEAFWRTAALGRPAREVAAELGVSANAVHVARCRVLRRLRRELDGLLG
jgi:RNA polymerase sigma-70 factor (ECF subfamily)